VYCNFVYHFGLRVPALFPTITPVNCATGLGMVCVPVNCFRCEPYSYSWSPMPPNSFANGNCLIAPAGHYTVCITNSCGDIVCCQVNIPPPIVICNIHLNIGIFIEGFYLSGGSMTPVLFNNGFTTDPTICDTIIVELHESQFPFGVVESATGLLHIDGTAPVEFPATLQQGDYYIVVRHRNSIETWSKDPVQFNGPVIDFDFTKQ
jgi:hypothetical protein